MVNKINQDFVGMRWLENGGGQSNTSKLRNETFRPLPKMAAEKNMEKPWKVEGGISLALASFQEYEFFGWFQQHQYPQESHCAADDDFPPQGISEYQYTKKCGNKRGR